MKKQMQKLANGAEFSSDNVKGVDSTLILINTANGNPSIGVEGDPTSFITTETFTTTGLHEIKIARGVNYKITLNNGEAWLADTFTEVRDGVLV